MFQLPTFMQRLASPDIKTVMLCGCGGGFDFVHSMVLYPALRALGKTVIIGSYSFGNPNHISGEAEVVFEMGDALVKRVTAESMPSPVYGPEVHLCGYLDLHYPDTAPHFAYAYYARAFTVQTLTTLYRQFINEHAIDAIVVVDGGSDSLMRGNENGLGDPAEDATSVAAISALADVDVRILISIGLGADRFNNVSDAATLRAIAELSRNGGFLGGIVLENDSDGLQFYRGCINYIYRRQTFRSVMAGMILASAEGYFGGEEIPPLFDGRVKEGRFFVWPLMAMLWAFDVDKVAQRSMMVDWIRDCETPRQALLAIYQNRMELGYTRTPIEDLPRHEDIRGSIL